MPIYRAHGRFIGPPRLFRYPDDVVKTHDRPSYASTSRNSVGYPVGARVDEGRWGAAFIAFMVARVLFPWLPPPLKKAFSLAVANVSSWVAPLKTVIFMPGGVFPTLSMPACLNQGG